MVNSFGALGSLFTIKFIAFNDMEQRNLVD